MENKISFSPLFKLSIINLKNENFMKTSKCIKKFESYD